MVAPTEVRAAFFYLKINARLLGQYRLTSYLYTIEQHTTPLLKTQVMNKSDLFILANKLAPIMGNRSQAMKRAWEVIKLRYQLRQGSVQFQFAKISDGSIRIAHGTLNPDLMKLEPQVGPSSPIGIAIPYFDLEKNAFRSFRADKFICAA